MSSSKDNKSRLWNTATDPSMTLDEENIHRLSVHNDIDSIDIPEITTQAWSIASDDQLPDINTVDDFHDSTEVMEVLIEKTPAFSVPSLSSADSPRKIPADPTLNLPESTATNSSVETVASSVSKTNLNHSVATPPTEVFQPLEHKPVNLEQDKYDKRLDLTLEAVAFTHPVENIASLVDNYTTVEKITPNSDFILTHNTSEHVEPIKTQTLHTESNKRIQTSVTFTSTINETVHNSEWTLFKAEQEKTQAHLKKRIRQLEKSIRSALLFSILAGILAGVSLIAAVSGLV